MQLRTELAEAIILAGINPQKPCFWNRTYKDPAHETFDLWLYEHRAGFRPLCKHIDIAFERVGHRPAATEENMHDALTLLRQVYHDDTDGVRTFLESVVPQYPHQVITAIIAEDALLTPGLLHDNLHALTALRPPVLQ